MSLGEIPGGNLRTYYNLENTTDSSGNGFTLTNNNSVAFSAGRFSNAADFGTSGTNKYLSYLGNVLSGVNPTNFFIGFWFKLNTTTSPTNGILFQLCTTTASAGGGVFLNCFYNITAGNLVVSCRADAGTIVTITTTASTSVWYNMQVTKAVGGGSYNFRMNQDSQNLNAGAVPSGSFSGQTVRLYIGGNGTNQCFCSIDEFLISESLYSQANGVTAGNSERRAYYTQAKGRFCI